MISSLMKFISDSTDTPMEPLIERHLDKNGNKLDMEKFRRYIRSRKPRSKAYNGPFVFVNNAIIEQAKHIIAHNKDTSYEEAIQFSYCNIMEHYITELWNHTKQMYEIDKQFAEDLFQTEADLIPFEAFAHLPYNTFCIDYDFSVHGMRCEGLVVDVYIDGKIVTVTAGVYLTVISMGFLQMNMIFVRACVRLMKILTRKTGIQFLCLRLMRYGILYANYACSCHSRNLMTLLKLSRRRIMVKRSKR